MIDKIFITTLAIYLICWSITFSTYKHDALVLTNKIWYWIILPQLWTYSIFLVGIEINARIKNNK